MEEDAVAVAEAVEDVDGDGEGDDDGNCDDDDGVGVAVAEAVWVSEVEGWLVDVGGEERVDWVELAKKKKKRQGRSVSREPE